MSEFNCKLEYLWLDGYETPNIRSKTKYTTIGTDNKFITVDDIPEWGFDGSSTLQADGGDSDCILQPVKVYPNTVDDDESIGMNSFIVLCEVYDTKGGVHPSNKRAELRRLDEAYSGSDMWFGIEQEIHFHECEDWSSLRVVRAAFILSPTARSVLLWCRCRCSGHHQKSGV